MTQAQHNLPKTSIIIPSYNGWGTLKLFLKSIIEQAKEHQSEIIIVDSSNDNSEKQIAEHFPEVTLIHSSDRLYPDEAKFRGANMASSEKVIFIDADCAPGKNWLAEKIAVMNEGHKVILGPIHCHPDCSLVGWAYFFVEFSFFSQYTTARSITEATSCNLAIEKSVVQRLPAFELKVRAADALFFQHLVESKQEIRFDPRSPAYHYYDETILSFLIHEFKHALDGAKISKKVYERKLVWITAYLIAFPVLPFLKLITIMQYIRRSRQRSLVPHFLTALPLTLGGCAAWTWGSCAGFISGLVSTFGKKKFGTKGLSA